MLRKFIILLFIIPIGVHVFGQPTGECKIFFRFHIDEEIFPTINYIFQKKENHSYLIDTLKSDTIRINFKGAILNTFLSADGKYFVLVLFPNSKVDIILRNKKIKNLIKNSNIKINLSKYAPNSYVSYYIELPLKYRNINIDIYEKEIITTYKKENIIKINNDGKIIVPYSN